jgi:hypothetical protein
MTLFDWTDNKTLHIANQYGNHVRSLRIVFRNKKNDGMLPDDLHPEDQLLHLISLCPDIQSIAFYYFQPPLPTWVRSDSSLMMSSILQLRRLNAVGIYTLQKFEIEFERLRLTTRQVETIAQSDRVSFIKRLDISMPILNKKIYDSLVSSFASLEHLSLHGSFPSFRGAGIGSLDWSCFRHLTDLSLAGDPISDRVYGDPIPDLVRTCTSLKRLFVSDLGTSMSSDPGRTAGWSTKTEGWWNQRTPLEYFQLDVAMRRTALRIGSIPALKMRLVVREDGHFDGLFTADHEVFPHLKVLTVRSGHVQREYDLNPDLIWTDPLCRLREERGVTLYFEGVDVRNGIKRRKVAKAQPR